MDDELNILHLNVQCLRNKLLYLEEFLTKTKEIHVLCITEHWLQENEIKTYNFSDFYLASYLCRKIYIHGGVSIYIRKNITSYNLDSITSLSIEKACEITAVHIKKYNTIILVVYRSPSNPSIDQTLNILQSSLQYLDQFTNVNIVLAGDFNINFLEQSPNKKNFLDIVNTFDLKQTIFDFTHEHKNAQTCIDNIFTNVYTYESKTLDLLVSDHKAQLINIKTCSAEMSTNNIKKNTNIRRNLSKNNLQNFKNLLQKERWTDVYAETSAETKMQNFMETFLFYHEQSFHLVKVNERKNKNWITQEVTEAKEKLLFFHSVCKDNPTEDNKNVYKAFKKTYHDLLIKAKQQHNITTISNSDNKSKTTWSIINNETGRKDKQKQSPGENLTPDMLNNFFTNFSESIVENLPKSKNSSMELCRNKKINNTDSMYLKPLIPEDVFTLIKQLKNKKSEDIYGLSVYLIKNVAEFIISPLCEIINACFLEGIFPSTLKNTKVIPIYKKGDITVPDNFRPIALLPAPSKILELAIYKQIYEHMERNKYFSTEQYGFKRNTNTSDATLKFIENVYDAFEEKQSCHSIFVDLSKAFDCVSHPILEEKLEYYGIRGPVLQLLKSYLKDRPQIVHCHGVNSQQLNMRRGVPQGSILGPLLFIIYTNDFPDNMNVNSINVRTLMYADDTTLTIRKQQYSEIEDSSEVVLTTAKRWFNDNELFLNESKTVTMSFSVNKIANKSSKFLGIHIDSSMTWNIHIDNICKKLSPIVFMLRRITCIINSEAALTCYHAIFNSTVRYGILSWGNAAHVHIQRILILQKAAIRAILKKSHQDSCKPLFKQLNIMTIFSLIIYENIRYVKEHINDFKTFSDVHAHDTRHKENLICPFTRLKKTEHIGLKLFNSLPANLKVLSANKFTQKLKEFLTSACLYNIQDFYSFCNTYPFNV